MKNKCTVIQIDGFRGLLILGFVIMCAIAGFIIFPAWCCQHAWNFIASYVMDMPLMELKHGAILWVIIALILYTTLFSKFKIAFVSANHPANLKHMGANISDEEILNAIEKRIKEKRSQLNENEQKVDELNSVVENIENSEEK